MLADGPFSIRPPGEVDDYGWLECDFRLTHDAGGIVESASVYVDDSLNREADFLPALIRHFRWDRGADLRRAVHGEITWPTATVSLSHFEDSRPQVDALIRSVQARLRALPVIVFGLSADRSVPDVASDPRGRVTVFTRNGVQSLAYTTSAVDEGTMFEAVLAGIAVLRTLVRPLDLAGWRESYGVDLTSPHLGGSRWWDYRPPATGTPAA